jgi:hypothetical protein
MANTMTIAPTPSQSFSSLRHWLACRTSQTTVRIRSTAVLNVTRVLRLGTDGARKPFTILLITKAEKSHGSTDGVSSAAKSSYSSRSPLIVGCRNKGTPGTNWQGDNRLTWQMYVKSRRKLMYGIRYQNETSKDHVY